MQNPPAVPEALQHPHFHEMMNHPRLLFAQSVLPFLFVLAIIAIISWRRIQQQKMWHETVRLALEKGQPLPPNLGAGFRRFGRHSRPWQIRRGLILLAVGAGMYVAMAGHGRVWGAVPAFVGIAILISAMFIPQPPPEAETPSDRTGSA